ncbi:helix-turn-helix domain-containing protein [Enterococcus villorum]|nr:helix-turn-helix domain-containing protein [Enterococcus villorum]
MTKLRILKKLMDSQGEWVSTAELSKELNMNVSKMRQLLKHFLDDLEELKVDIRIKIVKQHGIIVENCNYIKYTQIRKLLITSTFEYQLIWNFFREKIKKSQDFSFNYHISNPTFYRRLNFINEGLTFYGIKLHKFMIEGNERFVRSFLIQYFYEVNYGCDFPFKKREKETILQLIGLMERKMGFNLTNDSKERLCYLWMVSKIRRENHHFLDNPLRECSEFCLNNPYFLIFKEVFSPFLSKNEFMKNEMEYLFYGFFSVHINYSSLSINHLVTVKKMLENSRCQYKKASKMYLDSLKEKLLIHLPYTDKKILQIEIYSSCMYAWLFPIPVSFELDLNYFDYIKNISIKYPEFTEYIDLILDRSRTVDPTVLNRQYIIKYIAMIIYCYKNKFSFKKNIHIAVRLRQGWIQENIITEQIFSRFKNEYNLEVSVTPEQADILITDMPNEKNKNGKVLYLYNQMLDLAKLESWLDQWPFR